MSWRPGAEGAPRELPSRVLEVDVAWEEGGTMRRELVDCEKTRSGPLVEVKGREAQDPGPGEGGAYHFICCRKLETMDEIRLHGRPSMCSMIVV